MFPQSPATGWSYRDTVFTSYVSPTAFYIGTFHVSVGTYTTTDVKNYSPFQEASWAALANTGTGPRVYALRGLGNGEVLAVLRDGRLYKAVLP